MSTKKTVLLTNDDGFHARGIKCLYDVLSPHYNVVVAAPEKEQSGVAHTFTFMKPLFCREAGADDRMPGYIISGAPSDCVKFAISAIMKKKPDILVSGINDGDNSGVAAFYSGTVAAAREGAFYGIPSFAFSMYNRGSPHMEEYAAMAPMLIDEILNAPHPQLDMRVFYNINFPACDPKESKGFKVTWQSMANYEDEYKQIEDKDHPSYGGYRVYGDRYGMEESAAFDARAVLEGYIAVTPLNYDSTAHRMMPFLRQRIEDGID
ncbi:MAG: 5'/3'-nucleotidase SurE [Chitinispirillia bacterium]|nr:5'/3'-nucleotidase SurE [Chitinispirillia bacterium]MCL2241839.1 5'/3'-nucleotidase SurE [Chitinispirillia bacterium]